MLNENFFFASKLRAVFQRTWPVFLFSAATNGSLAPSQLKMSASPATIGEPPLPWTGEEFMHRYVGRVPGTIFDVYPRLVPTIVDFIEQAEAASWDSRR